MAKPIEVKDRTEFEAEVLAITGMPVLVDFWSHTCPHCTKLNPEYDAAADEQDGEVKFVKVAAQDSMDIFREFGVRGTPTLILFQDGEEAAREAGFKTAPQISAWLQQNL